MLSFLHKRGMWTLKSNKRLYTHRIVTNANIFIAIAVTTAHLAQSARSRVASPRARAIVYAPNAGSGFRWRAGPPGGRSCRARSRPLRLRNAAAPNSFRILSLPSPPSADARFPRAILQRRPGRRTSRFGASVTRQNGIWKRKMAASRVTALIPWFIRQIVYFQSKLIW